MFKTFDEIVVLRDFFSCAMRFTRGVYTVTGNRENDYGDPTLIRIRSVNTTNENTLGYWCEEPALINATTTAEATTETPEGIFYDEVHSLEPTSRDVYDRLEQLASRPLRDSR